MAQMRSGAAQDAGVQASPLMHRALACVVELNDPLHSFSRPARANRAAGAYRVRTQGKKTFGGRQVMNTRARQVLVSIFAVVVWGLLNAHKAHTQAVFGTFLGTGQDEEGAAVPNAPRAAGDCTDGGRRL